MAWPLKYGQQVSGLSVDGRPLQARVFNEREVRAAAGLLMMFGFAAFFYALLAHNFTPLKIAASYMLFDFLIRITVGVHRAPSGIVARWMTQRYPPEWVSAKPKRFAWTLGATIALSMTIITNSNIHGYLPRTLCLICVSLLWSESVLGLCIGCEIYAFLVRRGWASTDPAYEVCAGGVCKMPGYPEVTLEPLPAFVPAPAPAAAGSVLVEASERPD
jgi:hypothetical protein